MNPLAFTPIMSSSPALVRPGARWPVYLTAAGGAALMAGSALPWMSMFAGLKQYSGLLGLNGWMLLAVGLTLALTPVMERRSVYWPPLALIMTAGGLAIVLWAGSGLLDITGDAGNAFMVPRVGPGLPVALAGCALSLLASLVGVRMVPRR